MKRYWSADMHLGHGNVIEYAKRPFRDCHHMNKRLIDEANMRVKDDDVCLHVGDFSMRDGWRYRQRLNGNWLFLRGNHDSKNKVKTVGDWLFLRLSHFRIFVSHIPYFYRDVSGTATYLLSEEMIAVVESTCDFAVCGHVHEKWRVSRDGKIPSINVGVDVNNYRPVSDEELLQIYLKEAK